MEVADHSLMLDPTRSCDTGEAPKQVLEGRSLSSPVTRSGMYRAESFLKPTAPYDSPDQVMELALSDNSICGFQTQPTKTAAAPVFT